MFSLSVWFTLVSTVILYHGYVRQYRVRFSTGSRWYRVRFSTTVETVSSAILYRFTLVLSVILYHGRTVVFYRHCQGILVTAKVTVS